MKRVMTMSAAGRRGLVVLVATDAEAEAVQGRRAVSLLRRAAFPGSERAGVRNATTTASAGSEALRGDDIESVAARARRVAALRSAVGVRGRIPSGISESGVNKGTCSVPVDADVELVAARGRRVAALRSRMRTPERTPPEARSAA